MFKITNDKSGFVAVETVVVASIVLLSGVAGISAYVSNSQESARNANTQMEETMILASGEEDLSDDVDFGIFGAMLPGISADQVGLTQVQTDIQVIHEEGLKVSASAYPTTVQEWSSVYSLHEGNTNRISNKDLKEKYEYTLSVGLTEDGYKFVNYFYETTTGYEVGGTIEVVKYSKDENDTEWLIEDCSSTIIQISGFLAPSFSEATMRCIVRT